MLVFIIAFCSCEKPYREEFQVAISQKVDFEDPKEMNRVKGDAYEGNYYTHCEGKTPFSGGFHCKIPDSLTNCFLRFNVDFQFRKGGRNFGQAVVISMQTPERVVFWHTFDIVNYPAKKNEWAFASDSTQVYMDQSWANADFRVFGYDTYHKSFLDLDNLHITIKKVIVLNNIK
jgi:hypothetical protein